MTHIIMSWPQRLTDCFLPELHSEQDAALQMAVNLLEISR